MLTILSCFLLTESFWTKNGSLGHCAAPVNSCSIFADSSLNWARIAFETKHRKRLRRLLVLITLLLRSQVFADWNCQDQLWKKYRLVLSVFRKIFQNWREFIRSNFSTKTTLVSLFLKLKFNCYKKARLKIHCTAKIRSPRCLKIKEKLAFSIASEASYVYSLSGQKLIKNAKTCPFWRVFENLKLAVKQCYQTGQF